MKLETKKGNLVNIIQQGGLPEYAVTVVVQGCNCMCLGRANGGLAAQFNKFFPETMEADLATKAGDRSKLGTYSKALVNGVEVINAYTQFEGGANLDLGALRKCFKAINSEFGGSTQIVVLYPDIGCGIAGGKWDEIRPIIDEELSDCDHAWVELQL
jgi:O-acetyl-ADP-ribose deacetylase (regulator of RNase III)